MRPPPVSKTPNLATDVSTPTSYWEVPAPNTGPKTAKPEAFADTWALVKAAELGDV